MSTFKRQHPASPQNLQGLCRMVPPAQPSLSTGGLGEGDADGLGKAATISGPSYPLPRGSGRCVSHPSAVPLRRFEGSLLCGWAAAGRVLSR